MGTDMLKHLYYISISHENAYVKCPFALKVQKNKIFIEKTIENRKKICYTVK